MGPEPAAEDVALPGQEVVVDVHAPHRLEVAANDAVGDEGGEGGIIVAAAFDAVQRGGPDLQTLGILLVPLGDARVQIPAVVVEAGPRGDGPDRIEVLALELAKSHDHVGDLDAGVVDVVLDLDRDSLEAEQAAQRVAEGRVPQVADVRGLVRVDRRVLDDGLV